MTHIRVSILSPPASFQERFCSESPCRHACGRTARKLAAMILTLLYTCVSAAWAGLTSGPTGERPQRKLVTVLEAPSTCNRQLDPWYHNQI